MNFLITGGTGFLGSQLTNYLIKKGHHVYILTRSPEVHNDSDSVIYIPYDVDTKKLPQIYGVVNLAGESLFGYWSEEKKKKILFSRMTATSQVLELMKKLQNKPEVFISGSAVGYYGSSDEIIFTEKTVDSGDDFLSSVVVDWEKAASEAEELGIRTVYARFGIVLGKQGGSLPLMTLPVKLFVGGKIGDGDQWISWVHIEDAVRLLDFSLFNKDISGPVNITSPNPKRNKDFYKTLARVYKRPYWFPMPNFLMNLAMGEMSQLITKGQYVAPQKAIELGFEFKFAKHGEALEDIK